MANYGMIAVPLFIAAMLFEIIISTRKQLKLYNSKDTAANITLGLSGLFFGGIAKATTLAIFFVIYEFAPVKLEETWYMWLAGLIISDFIFYVFHRLGHESRFFWAAHQTHHSSAKFNFSTAVRVPFHHTHRYLFWAPMALMGFHPFAIFTIDSLSMIYQFFLHSKTMGKLGPLEWIFNTPSHHRVHHACNKQYLDRNYGGVFIIWDRLFGTFASEAETPSYGLTKPVNTYNPIRLAFDGYRAMWKGMLQQSSVREALRFAFARPGEATEIDPTERGAINGLQLAVGSPQSTVWSLRSPAYGSGFACDSTCHTPAAAPNQTVDCGLPTADSLFSRLLLTTNQDNRILEERLKNNAQTCLASPFSKKQCSSAWCCYCRALQLKPASIPPTLA